VTAAEADYGEGAIMRRRMTVEHESKLHMALGHARTGRDCIVRQHGVIASLRDKNLPTEQAEIVLRWLE
jgi:hypothetical protein